jgi:hypothetical protein
MGLKSLAKSRSDRSVWPFSMINSGSIRGDAGWLGFDGSGLSRIHISFIYMQYCLYRHIATYTFFL